jgi:hypothetical protein
VGTAAARPRADDQIKLHFDQDDWNNPAIYSKYLRLPPGTLSVSAASNK